MLGTAIGAIFVAWVLSWFGFEQMCIEAVKEWTGRDISVATYYVTFFVIGLIAGIFRREI